MKSFTRENRILLALLAAAVLISLAVIAGRWRVEAENKTYDVILDYNELELLAQQSEEDVSWWLEQFRACQALTGDGTYSLLLSHRPELLDTYAASPVDLVFTGHAHGGLIRLPGTDGLVGPKRELFPQYTAGLYDLSYGQMVVSRGLGNQFPCFRLLNRPDVPLVVLG